MLSCLSPTLHRIPHDNHLNAPATSTARLIGCHRRPDGEPQRDRLGRIQAFKDPILDAESWAIRQIEVCLRNLGMHITEQEKEDVISEVFALLLKAEAKFNPAINPSFAGYAAWLIPRRLIDIIPRALLGRNGGRIAQRSHEELDDRTAHRHQITNTEEPGDLLDHRRTDHRGLQRNGTSEAAWADTILGVRAA